MKRKTAFITGGTGAMGQAIALRLAKNGMNIIFQYHQDDQEAFKLRKQLQQIPQIKIEAIKQDLTDLSQVGKNLKKYTQIDVLIHTACPRVSYQSFISYAWTDWEKMYTVTIGALFIILRQFLPWMQSCQWGRIVNISSALVHNVPVNKLAVYMTNKSALSGLSKALAVELAPYQITVNTISPGVTDTKFLKNFPPIMKELILPKIPLKRLTQPNDVAQIITFLCSDAASYITGVDIPIAGGWVM